MKQRVEENGFDSWLESSVPEILPDEIVKQVTPWKKAMGQVLAGFVMTSLSLDIFYLDIILPAVGYLFFFLGFFSSFSGESLVSYLRRYRCCERSVFSGEIVAPSRGFSGIDLYKDSFSFCSRILYLWCFCFSSFLLAGAADGAAKSRIATTCQRCTGFDAVVSGVLFAADVFWLFRIAASCCIVCGVCFCGAECRKNHEGIRGCRICYGYCTHKNP